MSESEYSDQDYESSEDDQDSRQKNRDRARRLERSKPLSSPSVNGRSSDPSRSVYVCNVPYNYEWQDLKDLFRNEVGKVTFVESIKEGSFFIEFSATDMVQSAIKNMNRYEINGRNIVVKKHSDGPTSRNSHRSTGSRSSRMGSGSGGGSGNRCVYVCNIPYDCKAHTLKSHFRKEVGDVAAVDFIKDGCAFVQFKSSDMVKRAVEIMNRFEINGRKIVVKEEAPANAQGMGLQSNFSMGLPLSRGGSLMGEPNFNDPSNMMGYRNPGMGFSENSNMGGAPQSLLGPVPDRPPFGRPSINPAPYGESRISDSFGSSVSSGLPSNNFSSMNRSGSSGSGNSGHGLMGGNNFSDSSRNIGRGNKIGNTYGLSLEFLESKGITGPLVKKIFVANIDYKVDEESLKELFGIAGTVTGVELKKDDNGKSKGYGFVDFEHPVEAVQAISMLHEQLYYDRKLSVQMAKASQFEEIMGRKKDDKKENKLPRGLQSLGMGLGVGGSAMKDISITDLSNSCESNLLNFIRKSTH